MPPLKIIDSPFLSKLVLLAIASTGNTTSINTVANWMWVCQSDWAAAFYLLWRHGAGSDEDHCSSVAAHPKKKMPSIPCKLFFRKVECFCSSLVVSYRPIMAFVSYCPPRKNLLATALICTKQEKNRGGHYLDLHAQVCIIIIE